MIINEEKKFIWFWIPKTAGFSVWKTLKEEYSTYNFSEKISKTSRVNPKSGFIYAKDIDLLIWPVHITFDQLVNSSILKNINDFFKIAFVRNPYDRFYSAYLELINHHTSRFPNDAVMQKIKDVSFNQFVQEEVDINRIRFDPRFLNMIPGYSYTHHNNINQMNFIGRNENFEEDFKKVCSMLGINKQLQSANIKTAPENCVEKTVNNKTLCYKYLDKYESQTIQIVNELYARDFDFFDYEVLDPNEFPEELDK
jgi:hypothetical protein